MLTLNRLKAHIASLVVPIGIPKEVLFGGDVIIDDMNTTLVEAQDARRLTAIELLLAVKTYEDAPSVEEMKDRIELGDFDIIVITSDTGVWASTTEDSDGTTVTLYRFILIAYHGTPAFSLMKEFHANWKLREEAQVEITTRARNELHRRISSETGLIQHLKVVDALDRAASSLDQRRFKYQSMTRRLAKWASERAGKEAHDRLWAEAIRRTDETIGRMGEGEEE